MEFPHRTIQHSMVSSLATVQMKIVGSIKEMMRKVVAMPTGTKQPALLTCAVNPRVWLCNGISSSMSSVHTGTDVAEEEKNARIKQDKGSNRSVFISFKSQRNLKRSVC